MVVSAPGASVAGSGAAGAIAERYQTASFQNFIRTPAREPDAVCAAASPASAASTAGACQRGPALRHSAWAPTPATTTTAVSSAARDAVSASASTSTSAAIVATTAPRRAPGPRRASTAAPAASTTGSAASRYMAAMFGYWNGPL